MNQSTEHDCKMTQCVVTYPVTVMMDLHIGIVEAVVVVVDLIRGNNAIQKLVYAERNMAGVFELEITA